MTSLESNEKVMAFVEMWSQSVSQILSQSGFLPSSVEIVTSDKCDEEVREMGERRICLMIHGGGHLNGMGLVLSETGVICLGQILLMEPVNPSVELTDAYKKGAAEFVRQAAEHSKASFDTASTQKIEISILESEPKEKGAACGGLQISQDKLAAISLVVWAPEKLAKLLNARIDMNESSLSSHEDPSKTMQNNASAPTGAASPLDFLFDVKLDATIRFGERNLLLRDILQMGTNSVIELDRQITDPADLIVAGRLVAKGEIVVVNGNFGLRVTELVNNAQGANLLSA